MAWTPLRLLTWTGVLRSAVVPSPSWPVMLSPHAWAPDSPWYTLVGSFWNVAPGTWRLDAWETGVGGMGAWMLVGGGAFFYFLGFFLASESPANIIERTVATASPATRTSKNSRLLLPGAEGLRVSFADNTIIILVVPP